MKSTNTQAVYDNLHTIACVLSVKWIVYSIHNSSPLETDELWIADRAGAETDWRLPKAVRTSRLWLPYLAAFCVRGEVGGN